MKKAGTFILLCLFLSMFPPSASAREAALPPPWCSTEDYIQIEGSKAYQGACWEELQAMRNAAVEGEAVSTQDALQLVEGYDGGLSFELGLIAFQSACNAQDAGQTSWESHLQEAEEHFRTVAEGEPAGDAQRLAWLWYARCGLLSEDPDGAAFQEGMARLAAYPDFQARTALVCASMDGRIPADKLELLDAPVILLDGQPLVLSRDSWPEVVENRTMLPIRSLAESIGCWVEWDGGAQTVTIRRAGDVLTFTMGSDTALLGGLELPLETAPYVRDSRTFLPARAFLETMEQSVEWVQGPNVISVTENRALVGESAAIEDWVLALAPFNDNEYLPDWDFSVLGGGARSVENVQFCREQLGHPDAESVSDANFVSRNTLQYKYSQIYALLDGKNDSTPLYMYVDFVEEVGNACIFAQEAYGAGYLTYREVLYYCQDIIELFRKSFQSWPEVQEAYLYTAYLFRECGYTVFDFEFVDGQKVGGTRVNTYEYITDKLNRAMTARPDLYDDAMFQTEFLRIEEPWNPTLDFRTYTLPQSGNKIPALPGDYGLLSYYMGESYSGEDMLLLIYDVSDISQTGVIQEYIELLLSFGFKIDEEGSSIPYEDMMEIGEYDVSEDIIQRGVNFYLEKPSISGGKNIHIRILAPYPTEDGKEGVYVSAVLF